MKPIRFTPVVIVTGLIVGILTPAGGNAAAIATSEAMAVLRLTSITSGSGASMKRFLFGSGEPTQMSGDGIAHATEMHDPDINPAELIPDGGIIMSASAKTDAKAGDAGGHALGFALVEEDADIISVAISTPDTVLNFSIEYKLSAFAEADKGDANSDAEITLRHNNEIVFDKSVEATTIGAHIPGEELSDTFIFSIAYTPPDPTDIFAETFFLNVNAFSETFFPAPIPIPGALSLFLSGLAIFAVVGRRRASA